MKYTVKTGLVFVIGMVFTCKLHAQFIDKLGFNIGLTYTNQDWKFKSSDIEGYNHDYRTGILAFVSAEKELGRIFSLQVEIGYIQKGFINTMKFSSGNETFKSDNDQVVLHNAGLDISTKIKPFQGKVQPYLKLGIGSDYLIGYRDVKIVEPGSGLEFGVYRTWLEDFNPVNCGALAGMGLEISHVVYLEVLYNPSFTRNYHSALLQIKDTGWRVKMGLHIFKAKSD